MLLSISRSLSLMLHSPHTTSQSCRGQLGLRMSTFFHLHVNICSMMLAIRKHGITDILPSVSTPRNLLPLRLLPQQPEESGLNFSQHSFQDPAGAKAELGTTAPAQVTTSSAHPTSASAATQDLPEAGQESSKPTHRSHHCYFGHRL